jgi:hypothetical protein
VIVGEQTFGKGSVQSILPFQDGSALRLTTAKYYTPSHKVIHEHGITPDIIVSLNDDEEASIQLRRLPGGGPNIEEALRVFDPERRATLQELVSQDVMFNSSEPPTFSRQWMSLPNANQQRKRRTFVPRLAELLFTDL